MILFLKQYLGNGKFNVSAELSALLQTLYFIIFVKRLKHVTSIIKRILSSKMSFIYRLVSNGTSRQCEYFKREKVKS